MQNRTLRKMTGLFFALPVLALVSAGSPAFAQNTPESVPAAPAAKFVTRQQGRLPIILSAPHGGTLSPPGLTERKQTATEKFVTVRDTNTDLLAKQVAAELEKRLGAKVYLIVAQFDRKYLDVNRPAKDAYESDSAKPYYDIYHAALQADCDEVMKIWGRGLLIDLHGQAADKDAIFRGTNNGTSPERLIATFGMTALVGTKSILGQLEKSGYTVLPGNATQDKENPRYNGGYIVQTYGSHHGGTIDAIQLEYGTNLRQRSRLDRTAADLADAIEVFAREYLPRKPEKETAFPAEKKPREKKEEPMRSR